MQTLNGCHVTLVAESWDVHLWGLFCSACVKQCAEISAAMHHSYDLYPARDLAIEDQVPLDWKVAQSWPDVWPSWVFSASSVKCCWKLRMSFVAEAPLFSAI